MNRTRESGFTLMEILVALFVMGVGLALVMAAFPMGIKKGAEAVKDTYSGILAQSVTDSFKVAMRENRFDDPKGKGTYLVFDHDGITDDPSKHSAKKPDYSKDFILLLPEYFEATKTKTFVYPETSGVMNGNGASTQAEDDGERLVEDRDGNQILEITKAYHVGQFLKKQLEDPDVSEYQKREIISNDPYIQYAFAIIIKRARTDTDRNGRVDDRDGYSNFLFEVTVNIYRNFKPEPKSKGNRPIHVMTTYMEL